MGGRFCVAFITRLIGCRTRDGEKILAPELQAEHEGKTHYLLSLSLGLSASSSVLLEK